MRANPCWTNVQKIHHKTLDPKIFISHIPLLQCARTAHNVKARMRSNQCWTNVPKIYHKTLDPKIFISHIPLLNCARTAHNVKARMRANQCWTNVPKIHRKTLDRKIFISHIPVSIFARTVGPYSTVPCFELCRNSSPCYTAHVCQPIVESCTNSPRYITNDWWLSFANPSSSNVQETPPKISVFTL